MCDNEFEISVWMNGTEKWLSGISKRTTCDDIIYALLYHENIHETENSHSYAIYECWKGIETCLQGRTKILRIWKKYASDSSNIKFVMRQLDCMSESSEYSTTKRKYRRWRHQKRYEHNFDRNLINGESHGHGCHSRNENFNCCESHNNFCNNKRQADFVTSDPLDRGKLRRLQKIIKLVMNQEKKIKSLANRIEETELLIGKYEEKIHFQRIKKKGADYVQRSLLQDSTSTSEDSLEDFVSKANLHLIEDYVEMQDRLIAVCELLAAEEDSINQLSLLIKQHGGDVKLSLSDIRQKENDPSSFSSSSETEIIKEISKKSKNMNGNAEGIGSVCSLLENNRESSGCVSSSEKSSESEKSELESLKYQFNRVMTVSNIQNITMDQLNQELNKYNKLQGEKSNLIHSLEKDLLEAEMSSATLRNSQRLNDNLNQRFGVSPPEIDGEEFIIPEINTRDTSEMPKISKIIQTSHKESKDVDEVDTKSMSNDLIHGVNNSGKSNNNSSSLDSSLKEINMKCSNNSKSIVSGSLPKSQFIRTKSMRDWTTKSNSKENDFQANKNSNKSFGNKQMGIIEQKQEQSQKQETTQQQHQDQHQHQHQQQPQTQHQQLQQLKQYQPFNNQQQTRQNNELHEQQQLQYKVCHEEGKHEQGGLHQHWSSHEKWKENIQQPNKLEISSSSSLTSTTSTTSLALPISTPPSSLSSSILLSLTEEKPTSLSSTHSPSPLAHIPSSSSSSSSKSSSLSVPPLSLSSSTLRPHSITSPPSPLLPSPLTSQSSSSLSALSIEKQDQHRKQQPCHLLKPSDARASLPSPTPLTPTRFYHKQPQQIYKPKQQLQEQQQQYQQQQHQTQQQQQQQHHHQQHQQQQLQKHSIPQQQQQQHQQQYRQQQEELQQQQSIHQPQYQQQQLQQKLTHQQQQQQQKQQQQQQLIHQQQQQQQQQQPQQQKQQMQRVLLHHPQQQKTSEQNVASVAVAVDVTTGRSDTAVSTANSSILKLDKSDDTDSTSDTGLGSMPSDDFLNTHIETLV